MSGEIVWCTEGAAGLRFESAVVVADWLPQGRAIASQQKIDEVFHQARVGGSATASPGPADCSGSKLGALDLMRIKEAMESLAVQLASDPGVIERYASKLQVLDIAAQALGKIATER